MVKFDNTKHSRISKNRYSKTVTLLVSLSLTILRTIKPVYNDHHRDPKIVVIADRWPLLGAHLCNKKLQMEPKNGGRYKQVVVSSGLTVPRCHAYEISVSIGRERNL